MDIVQHDISILLLFIEQSMSAKPLNTEPDMVSTYMNRSLTFHSSTFTNGTRQKDHNFSE